MSFLCIKLARTSRTSSRKPFDLAHLLQDVQEYECNQGDRDPNPNGVLRLADEMADFQGLLHQPKEQLDLPTKFVKIGYLLRFGIEIVAENTQPPPGLGRDHDLAYRNLHRILAVVGKARRQKPNTVAYYAGSRCNGQLFGGTKRRVGFEARHDPATGGIEFGPPAVIIIAEVVDVSGARIDRHFLGRDIFLAATMSLTLAALTMWETGQARCGS